MLSTVNFMPFYFGLMHSLDFWGVIFNLQPNSFPSIVCCVLRFCFLYVFVHVHVHNGVPGCISFIGTPPPQCMCTLRFVSFFPSMFAPKTPPTEKHPWTSTYMEGIRKWESKGALRAILVHVLWAED